MPAGTGSTGECVTAEIPWKAAAGWQKEGNIERYEYGRSAGNQVYVEGLKRYQKKGIRVLIDGEDASDATWGKLFENREDGSFYMGDYILEDIPRENLEQEVKEEPENYMKQRRLKEIHFDIVYHR